MPEFRARLESKDWESFLFFVEAKMKNPATLLTAAFATRGLRDIIQHFEAEEGPDGKWPPRSESTQRRYDDIAEGRFPPPNDTPRQAYSSSNKLLQLTGELRKSLMPAALGRQTRRVSHDSIMVYSPVPYSGIHDEGDPALNIPERSFMWLSDKAQDDMLSIMLQTLAEGR